MSSIKRPSRLFSFTDWNKSRPKEPPPGDRLDAQIQDLIDAIVSTQRALADIRRDDGRLKNRSVAAETLDATLADQLGAAIEGRAAVEGRAALMLQRAEQSAVRAVTAEQNLSLYARDAEAAAVSAGQFLSAANTAQKLAEAFQSSAINAVDAAEAEATDSENWAQYSKAQADNAIKAKDEALQWAEYLAGPVINADEAPAYIADSPFPHGLYYQPVEGYGGVAGLWSAKWWAVYAAQLVGPWGFYYLGGWYAPPLPGAVNPDTGIKVPNPLAPGSFYYDIDTGTMYVWNGSEWKSPYTLASGAVSRFVYLATDGQTAFSGADYNGAIPDVGLSPSDVHLNGVRLVDTIDYHVDAATSTLTLINIAVTAGSVVQWDLLVPPDDLIPGNVHNFKTQLTPSTPDGTVTVFTMQYAHPVHGPQPVNVTDGSQLQVSLDGIVQEPGVDYAASGNTLTMAKAPISGARFWVVWFSNAVLT